jgi:hypothetical protein
VLRACTGCRSTRIGQIRLGRLIVNRWGHNFNLMESIERSLLYRCELGIRNNDVGSRSRSTGPGAALNVLADMPPLALSRNVMQELALQSANEASFVAPPHCATCVIWHTKAQPLRALAESTGTLELSVKRRTRE